MRVSLLLNEILPIRHLFHEAFLLALATVRDHLSSVVIIKILFVIDISELRDDPDQ